MTKDSIHREIKLILDKIKIQNENLEKERGKISMLETDILRKYCIDLYDLINQIQHVKIENDEIQIIKEPVKNEEKLPELKPIEYVEKVIIIENTEKIEVNEQKNWDPPKFEPIKEKPVVQEIKFDEKPVYNEESNTKTNNTVFENKKTSIHETISVRSESKEMIEKYANTKIDKIITAIDISKRFELQQNLFKSDNHSFTDAINRIENSGNLETALRIFDHLAKLHHWDLKNELVKEFKSFIYRRY